MTTRFHAACAAQSARMSAVHGSTTLPCVAEQIAPSQLEKLMTSTQIRHMETWWELKRQAWALSRHGQYANNITAATATTNPSLMWQGTLQHISRAGSACHQLLTHAPLIPTHPDHLQSYTY